VGHSQLSLAAIAFMSGDVAQSVERTLESLQVRYELRDSRGLCDCIGMTALHASVQGDHGFAAVLLGAAEVAREAAGYAPIPWLRPMLDQAEETSRSALGDGYPPRHAEGHKLSVDEAVQLIVSRRDEDGEAPQLMEATPIG
jgi:hypothetical protein